jgi:hypothetical protein
VRLPPEGGDGDGEPGDALAANTMRSRAEQGVAGGMPESGRDGVDEGLGRKVAGDGGGSGSVGRGEFTEAPSAPSS